jgi:tetratricopeptide (TPR) repeat protein
MAYRGVRKPLKEVARELGVEAVVEGSITRSGNRVRVRAQLIDARTDQHRWARSYERDITDVVDMESEMAAQVAEQVSLQLSPSKRSASEGIHPRTADAYEYYLKGWYFFDKRTPQAAGESVAYFRKSIEQDPLFAQAHAGLAEALELLSNMDVAAYRQTEPESLAEVRRALELNPKLGEAHSALGLIEAQWNWNWPEAERQMKAGLELSPGSAVVHERYAMYLQAMGQVDKAVLEARRALELDPLSFFMNRELGRSLYLARRYDEAVKQLEISTELYPNNTAVNNWLRWIAERQGKYPLAMQMGVLSAAESSTPPNLVRVLREAADSRDWTRYCETERRMHETGRSSSSSFFIAEDELRLGHKDAAFKWLERSLKEKTVWIMWIKVDPLLDDMRSDPRFRALLERMGLD